MAQSIHARILALTAVTAASFLPASEQLGYADTTGANDATATNAVAAASSSIAAEAIPQVSLKIPEDKTIQGLSFLTRTGPLKQQVFNDKQVYFADFRAKFVRQSWTLTFDGKLLKMNPAGDFVLRVPAYGKKTEYTLIAVGPKGEQEILPVTLAAPPKPASLVAESSTSSSTGEKRFTSSFALGVTDISYQETRAPEVHLLQSTAKAAGTFRFNKSWDVSANGYFPVATLTTSLPGTSIRFLGVNARVGYSLPFIKSPWTVGIAVGAYYSRMFVTGVSLGYSDLLYPQIYPSVRRQLSGNQSIYGYIKYVPLGSGIISYSSDEREIAVGAGYDRGIFTKNRLIVSLDYSNMALLVTPQYSIKNNTLTFGVGMGF